MLNVASGYLNRLNVHLDPTGSKAPLIELINIANEFIASSNRKEQSDALRVQSSFVSPPATGLSEHTDRSETETLLPVSQNAPSQLSDFIDDTIRRSSVDFSTIDQVSSRYYQRTIRACAHMFLGFMVRSTVNELFDLPY